MHKKGVLQRLAYWLYCLISSARMILFYAPIIMALIPGPGAVLLSAPIVDEATKKIELNGTEKAYINYWFRIAIQTSSPVTFSFLMATSIVEINELYFFINLLPFTLVMLITGYYFQLHSIRYYAETTKESKFCVLTSLLKDLMFLWIFLLFYLIFDISFSISTIMSIGWVVLSEKVKLMDLLDCSQKGMSVNLTFMILGVMFFSSVVKATRLMEEVVAWSLSIEIPIVVISIFMPFLIGITIGAYSGTIALVFGLFGHFSHSIPYLVMIFVISRIGNYVSPINSSVLISIEYFSGHMASFYAKLYKSLIPLVVCLLSYLVSGNFNLGL